MLEAHSSTRVCAHTQSHTRFVVRIFFHLCLLSHFSLGGSKRASVCMEKNRNTQTEIEVEQPGEGAWMGVWGWGRGVCPPSCSCSPQPPPPSCGLPTQCPELCFPQTVTQGTLGLCPLPGSACAFIRVWPPCCSPFAVASLNVHLFL